MFVAKKKPNFGVGCGKDEAKSTSKSLPRIQIKENYPKDLSIESVRSSKTGRFDTSRSILESVREHEE